MALSESKLKTEFQKFADQEFGAFSGFPETKEDAKQAWADAFQAYIDDIVIISPTTVNPTNTSATTSGCGSAFRALLVFDNSGGSPSVAATEISDAWEAGMNALILVPGADYNSGNIIQSITPFSNITTNKATLKIDLETVFNSLSSTNEEPVADIAVAIHSATTASISTTCVYLNNSPSPPTLSGPLVFG